MSSNIRFTPRQILDSFYEAERIYMSSPPDQRDFTGIAATLAPDFRMEQTSALPYAGVYIGPSGMQDWARRMADYFEVVDVRNPEIFESPGSDRIVVLSTVHFKVRGSGQEMEYPFCQAVTVDCDRGVMTEMRPFYWDVAGVNAALGVGRE
ncbi:hypothetical protein MYU51_016943 [Penicillium brevicompactum]|uniref:uncharacterized protein n=1 Tax=Penicillium brevicompactum TaxID=5074 RepID=UPI0025404F1D|nr:uncharacterized protein N7506_001695 [Penicillium brevicompactum]KAJ5348442.1 hypothetical protein N7506_001695 [Penicillium brevicompactum]